jgi:hypothetical protein
MSRDTAGAEGVAPNCYYWPVAPVSWWFSSDDLLQMDHLGRYVGLRKGAAARIPVWFTDGVLDPARLIESELFSGKAVEAVTEIVYVPASICADISQRNAYLRQQGWDWSPDRPEGSWEGVAARTASGVTFWIEPAGLLAEFRNFPGANTRWAGFLLACHLPAHLSSDPAEWGEFIKILDSTATNMPWLKRKALDQRTTFKQARFKIIASRKPRPRLSGS